MAYQYREAPSRAFAGGQTRLPFLQSSGRRQRPQKAKAPAQHQAHGVSSIKGRRNYMEDEWAAVYDLSSASVNGMATNYFGVFDGHAGGRASKACAR